MIVIPEDLGWPLLSLLLIFPAVGALLCATPLFSQRFDAKGSVVRFWSIGISGLIIFHLVILSNFVGEGFVGNAASVVGGSDALVFQVQEKYPWIPSIGAAFSLTLDGLSYVFCALTALVTFAVLLWSQPKGISPRAWCATVLAGQCAVMGAFLASDLVLFYVFYEIMLLPVVAGIALWGGVGRIAASYKFALYTLVGSVLMFLSILYIGWSARTQGVISFELSKLLGAGLFSPKEQILLGAAFFLAFAVKAPVVPFHSWLPDTYREAPHGIAAFVAALLGKVGLYGLIRFAIPLFPSFFDTYGEGIAMLGAVGVVYGALAAMHQLDIRLLLAYSSISHLGFCILGIAARTPTALSGAVFQAISHGVVTAGLFLLFGHLIDLRKSQNFVDFGGLAGRIPRNAFFLMVFSLAAVALPLTSSFVGEFMILIGSYTVYPVWTLLAMAGVVLGAVYTFTAYLRVMFGVDRCTDVQRGSDLAIAPTVVAAALALVILFLGVYPKPVLSIIESGIPGGSKAQLGDRAAGDTVAGSFVVRS
jgi:NADH-quinone oxidoreductase subunit M